MKHTTTITTTTTTTARTTTTTRTKKPSSINSLCMAYTNNLTVHTLVWQMCDNADDFTLNPVLKA